MYSKFRKINLIFFIGLLLSLALPIYASTPVWTFTPLTPTNLSIDLDSIATVQYRVTNQSKVTHTLTMQPIAGINQITTAGFCANPFELAYQQSCILNLQIVGANLPANVNDGPLVCQISSLSCYKPSPQNILSLTVVKKIGLVIGNSPLSLVAGGAAGGITITNNSGITLLNLKANLTGTALAANVIQDASHCVSLAPGQTCTLSFTPLNAVTLTSFPITADNSSPAVGQIQIASPSIATLSVTGSPLTLQATTGTPVTGFLTVTNQSTILTATNVSANLTGTLSAAGVTENSSNCNSILPQQSCHLVFTPSTQAAINTNVSIQGSNTSVTSGNISVNGAPQATISITAGSPLYLTTSSVTGTLTITNNSPTEKALGIASNFTSTALNGFVTETGNTCSSVTAGASCTLTYTPGATVVAQTNFPIQGSNTTSVTGAISINAPGVPIIFLSTNTHGGNLGGFSGANALCNSDPGKPTTGFAAAYTYKALLMGNNATTTGKSYYRPNGVTLIAVATGGNLVGASNLVNVVGGASQFVWTGGDGTNNCSNWASTSANQGAIGEPDVTTSLWWNHSGEWLLCTSSAKLYCASQ